jgi:hypothetical protein
VCVGIWLFWRFLLPDWAFFPTGKQEPIPYFRVIFNTLAVLMITVAGATAGMAWVVCSIEFDRYRAKKRQTPKSTQKEVEDVIKLLGIDAVAFFWLIRTCPGRHLWLHTDKFGLDDGLLEIRGHIAILTSGDLINVQEQNELMPNCKLMVMGPTLTEGVRLTHAIKASGFAPKLDELATAQRAKLVAIALNIAPFPYPASEVHLSTTV